MMGESHNDVQNKSESETGTMTQAVSLTNQRPVKSADVMMSCSWCVTIIPVSVCRFQVPVSTGGPEPGP